MSYIYNLVDTWASGGGPYTSIKMNATDNDSGSASLLMDLQVGGASRFQVQKSGNILNASNQIRLASGFQVFQIDSGNQNDFRGIVLSNIQFSLDTHLTRRAAANLRLGAADAAAPVAQTLSVQSVVAGTSNTAGANLTITGSQGTGTGAGGSIVFQVAPAGSSGTAQNALADALTISSARNLAVGGASIQFGAVGSGTRLLTSGKALIVDSGNTNDFGSVSASSYILNSDVILARDAANTLALRNGANAQTFRVYNTTDGTNSEFGFAQWSGNIFQIGTGVAGTGTNRTIDFVTNGATRLSVGVDGHTRVASGRNLYLGAATYWTEVSSQMRLTGGSLEMVEQTAPAAPSANNVRIYAEDDGAGKTRLMARFATGAAVQIAIEP